MFKQSLIGLILVSCISCTNATNNKEPQIRFLDELSSIPDFSKSFDNQTQTKLSSSFVSPRELESFLIDALEANTKEAEECQITIVPEKKNVNTTSTQYDISGDKCPISYEETELQKLELNKEKDSYSLKESSESTLKVENSNFFVSSITTIIAKANAELISSPSSTSLSLPKQVLALNESPFPDDLGVAKLRVFENKEITTILGPSATIQMGLVTEKLSSKQRDTTLKVSIIPFGGEAGLTIIAGGSVIEGRFEFVGARINGKDVEQKELQQLQDKFGNNKPANPFALDALSVEQKILLKLFK